MANYAPIDEVWPQTDDESTFRSTYAVYGAQPRPELHRPETTRCGPIGFQADDILATSQSHGQIPQEPTFTRQERQISPRAVSSEPRTVPVHSRCRSRSVDMDADMDLGQFLHRRSSHQSHRCTSIMDHVRDCRHCRDYYRDFYMVPQSGMFWWLESRDAFILIGGLIVLVLAGILIKRG